MCYQKGQVSIASICLSGVPSFSSRGECAPKTTSTCNWASCDGRRGEGCWVCAYPLAGLESRRERVSGDSPPEVTNMIFLPREPPSLLLTKSPLTKYKYSFSPEKCSAPRAIGTHARYLADKKATGETASGFAVAVEHTSASCRCDSLDR